MPEYRVRCGNEESGWRTLKLFQAPNDYEALIKARQMNTPQECELWQDSRMVAVIRPRQSC
jgi:hypothetical protein